VTHERFNRILNWTCDDQANGLRELVGYSALGPEVYAAAKERFGAPAPWPVIMLAQRLHWQGRTQEAYDMAARLS